MDLQLFAEEAQEPTEGNPAETPAEENQDGGEKPVEKTFTQDELDAVISKRLARERKTWEKQMDEERQKAAMTESERLAAEKAEAEKKADEAMGRANRILITAEAKAVAAELGVLPERLSYAVRLADLDAIEAEDGEVDTASIKAAMQKVITDLPELKRQTTKDIGSATNPGTKSSAGESMNEFIRRAAGRF